EYKLTNSIVTSVKREGHTKSEETLPTEVVTFSYGKIEMVYTQQKREDGSGGGKKASGWDLQANKKV
ncbi:MAG: Hcp1 family type VI secretion system effector, partial [Deltaproteobacteria bacterium]